LLHGYWQAGNFPVNEDYAYRTPIFIDKHDNFCAVGYLVKASGYESVSRMIAANTNLAYVREMKYPELDTWARYNGFTTDELAWIQPGYPPTSFCYSKNIGGGVDGMVNELFVDNTTERMYVGGSFVQADGTITANNVAYVTVADTTYTWHEMNMGVNGTVNAITKFGDNIWVGGSFSTAGEAPANNIAYWDGSNWHSAGCINGTVHDLVVFGGAIFASGDFDSCTSGGEVNFAKWDGADWLPIPGLIGRVNTMEAGASSITLGGAFTFGTTTNAISWQPGSSFQTFYNSPQNEVMDFEVFGDTLHAVCKRTHSVDTNTLFLKLRETTWLSAATVPFSLDDFYDTLHALSFNTLCVDGTSLNIGGQFLYSSPVVPAYYDWGYNSFAFAGGTQSVDSAVNKMIIFNNDFIIAGKFKRGRAASGIITLNGIAKRKIVTVSVPATTTVAADNTVVIFPNPVTSGGIITIENNFHASYYSMHHITGREFARGAINKSSGVTLPPVPAGMYIITLSNDAGDKAVRKIVVE
jgi:hypothetical protein